MSFGAVLDGFVSEFWRYGFAIEEVLRDAIRSARELGRRQTLDRRGCAVRVEEDEDGDAYGD